MFAAHSGGAEQLSEVGENVRYGAGIYLFWLRNKVLLWYPSCLCKLHQSWAWWKELCWGLCRHTCGLGAARGMQWLTLLLQQCTDWVGSTRAKGRSVLDTLRDKEPQVLLSFREGTSWASELVPMWAAGQQGGKARLVLALTQNCSLPLQAKVWLSWSCYTRSSPSHREPCCVPFPKLLSALRAAGLGARCPSLQRKTQCLIFGRGLVSPQVVPVKVKCSIFLIFHCSVSAGSDTKWILA